MSGWLSERQRDGGIDEVPLPDGVPGSLRLCGKRAIADGRFEQPGRPWGTVVCLCQRHELAARYPDYVTWMDGAADSDEPERAIWWPVHDLGAEPIDRMLPFVDDLVERLRSGHDLLIHCAAGFGRAGTTAVCILIRLGIPADEAMRTVHAARPQAGPEVGSQLELVRAFAAATPS